jgi:hypothetical protein
MQQHLEHSGRVQALARAVIVASGPPPVLWTLEQSSNVACASEALWNPT